MQRIAKSVTIFAYAKTEPLFAPADARRYILKQSKEGEKMRTKMISVIGIIIALQGPAHADVVTDFNNLIGGICRDTWASLGKNSGWDISKIHVSKDSLFTYETTPVNTFITCSAIYSNDSSTDNGAWNIRFSTADPGKNAVLTKLNSSTGNWDIVK